MIPNAGQDNQAQEKRWNHLLISMMDSGITLPDQSGGKALNHGWGRLHRQPHRPGPAGGGPRAAGPRRFQQQQPDRA